MSHQALSRPRNRRSPGSLRPGEISWSGDHRSTRGPAGTRRGHLRAVRMASPGDEGMDEGMDWMEAGGRDYCRLRVRLDLAGGPFHQGMEERMKAPSSNQSSTASVLHERVRHLREIDSRKQPTVLCSERGKTPPRGLLKITSIIPLLVLPTVRESSPRSPS